MGALRQAQGEREVLSACGDALSEPGSRGNSQTTLHADGVSARPPYVVTAPFDAEPTSRAYLAITPAVNRGTGGCHKASRALISLSLTASCNLRFRSSNKIMSPSRTMAIGPPLAASGATCPAIIPRVAPEKRPSVKSATDSPRPAPTIAATSWKSSAGSNAARAAPTASTAMTCARRTSRSPSQTQPPARTPPRSSARARSPI